MSKSYYIFQAGAENLRHWVRDPAFRHSSFGRKNEQWFWSANQHAKPGDIAFIYLTAPLSRIVGQVDVIGTPFFHHEETMFDNPHMANKWCVEVGNPIYFGDPSEECLICGRSPEGHDIPGYHKPKLEDAPLSIRNLRKIFSVDWGWVRYPRGNTRVPDEILPALQELIKDFQDQQPTKATMHVTAEFEVGVVTFKPGDEVDVEFTTEVAHGE